MPEDEGRKLSELQPATGQIPEHVYGISSGLSLKFTPKQVVDAGRPFATEAQAAAGIRTDLGMSPALVLAAMEQYAADVTNPSIAQVQQNVTTVQANLNTTNGVVSSINGRVATLETTVNALPATIRADITAGSYVSVAALQAASPLASIVSVIIDNGIYKRDPTGPVIAANGSRWRLQGFSARPIEMLFAYSQSNFAGRNEENNWVTPPPDNLWVWNGGNWSGDITPPIGDAFVPASTRNPQVPIAYAAELARDNPGTDYYLVIIARGGTGVTALTGIRYRFSSNTTGAPPPGGIGAGGGLLFNAGNTQVSFADYDLFGDLRFTGSGSFGNSTFYLARIESTLDGGNSWIEFAPGAMTDQGDYRTQAVTVTGSANWPPADGTDVTAFPAMPRMRTLFKTIIPLAMNAVGLTGQRRVFSKVLIWPTEGDINYYNAYRNRDFDFILTFLSQYVRDNTKVLMTLPYPYGENITSIRGRWWTAIRDIQAVNPDMRTLVSLVNSGSSNWGDSNNIHAINREAIGVFMRRSEETGGTAPVFASGVYTPTLSNSVNIASSTLFECMWTRIGDIVTVSGRMVLSATANSTATSTRISLPIPSDIPSPVWLSGTATSNSFPDHSGFISGNQTTDNAVLEYTSRGLTGTTFAFQFSYRVLGFD